MKSSLKILVADDEPIVSRTLVGYMSDLGHKIDKAYDAVSALELIESNKYDLTIIDLHIPDANGLSILRDIQRLQPEMPVVVITCNGNINMAIESLRLGAADFLTKPIRMLELEGALLKSIRLGKFRSQQNQTIERLEKECNLLKDKVNELKTQLDKTN